MALPPEDAHNPLHQIVDGRDIGRRTTRDVLDADLPPRRVENNVEHFPRHR